MKSQKIANLLDNNNTEPKKFSTRKWYIINGLNNTDYKNDYTIKFETKVIKPNLCDYSDAYILVTGTITAIRGGVNTKAAFKNCLHLLGVYFKLMMST